MPTTSSTATHDVVLIGGGIMSATLGTLLKQLQPDWKILVAEYVETGEGTGIVHQAPAYGADDQEVCAAAGIPVVAFNGVYDFTVMDREARRHGLTPLEARPVIDPFVLDKQVDRFRKGKRTLSAVSEHYGVTLENAHTSAADALAAVQVADALAARYEQLRVAPVDLHERQVRWKAEQAESFEQYLRRKDPQATVSRHWPVEAER